MIRQGILLCAFALGLSGCKPDMDFLVGLLPSEVTQIRVLASDRAPDGCQQATFEIAPPDPEFAQDWDRLPRLYSSSFITCLDADEKDYWQDQASLGNLRAMINDTVGYEVHYWYAEKTHRLLVMVLDR